MKLFTTAALTLLLSSGIAAPALAQYPGEPTLPDRAYDPVREMNYDRQWGMPDETVRQAQQLLHDQGYYDGPIHGVVADPRYLTAIWKFQKAHGLRPTTHLDPSTLAALGVPATGMASPRPTVPNNFGAGG